MQPHDDYLRRVIADAEAMTNSIEERAVSILYARGDMANFDNDWQREIEARVRELLTED